MDIATDVRAILDAIGDPAILLGADYRILLANQAYEAAFGDGRPLRRRRCYEVSHGNSVPCDVAGEHCPLRSAEETGQTSKVLHVHHTPRGHEYINVETWPVKGSNGQIKYFVEVLRPSNIAEVRPGQRLVGRSPAFQRMLGCLERVAPSETSVLLLGESGTGKELVAHTIHERSQRAAGPFVPVECTGLPESLFESEMFGHVKGSFTGASSDKLGLVAAAEGGTLFLDEVGDMNLGEQVKLLRLLETRQFRRVGSTEPQKADFRLICATNKNLEQMVAGGAFREDLYYRIAVFEILLPPLRDRNEDIPLLVESTLKRLGSGLSMSPSVIDCLSDYQFPGNVRELRNVIERAVLMCDGDTILADHLPDKFCRANPNGEDSDDSSEIRNLADMEADHIREALRQHRGSRASLAKLLGISERALYRKISQLKSR